MPLQTLVRCHPSLISHLWAVHSLIGPLGVMPNSAKMISLTAWQSFWGVTSPVFWKVSQSCVFSWTHSSCNQDLALAAPPQFLIRSFLKIWKCWASTQTHWANQFPWPSCHCHAISKLAWVWETPLRWRVAKLDMMRYWLSWERGNDYKNLVCVWLDRGEEYCSYVWGFTMIEIRLWSC